MIMRVIAKAGQYRVVQELNGLVTIYKDLAQYICDNSSAYELIRQIAEPAIRVELLKQWQADKVRGDYAEKQTREGN